MTDVQRQLLDLAQEFDALCRKYDITYYLAGGCEVGAVRNGGFLPWDDDVDVHMNYENAVKLLKALEKEKPANRIIQQPSEKVMCAHWRYRCLENTNLERGNISNDIVEGKFIDIFILYPLPRDEKKKEKCVEYYQLYDELHAKIFTYVSLRPKEYLRKYYVLRLLGRIFGRDRIIRYLENKVFNYPEKDTDEYVLRAPFPPQYRYKKEWWGTPRYVDFETTKLPVPEYSEKILSYSYGPSWFEVPNYEVRGSHVFVMDLDVPYTAYKSNYGFHLDLAEFYTRRAKQKECWFDLLWDRNDVMPQVRELQGLSVALQLQKEIEDRHIDLQAMVENKQADELAQLFKPYFEKASSDPITYYGVYVDMPDEYLYAALYFPSLAGEPTARRVLKQREERVERELPPGLKHLCQVNDATDELHTLLYGDYDMERARALADEWIEKEPNALYFLRADLYLRLNGWGAGPEDALMRRCDAYLERYPQDGELLKYRGDILLRQGMVQEGERCYREALCTMKNGFAIRAVKEYFKAKDTIGF